MGTLFYLPKKRIRLHICPLAIKIIRNPILPCMPPIGEWRRVPPQWKRAIRPETTVRMNSHHRILVTGFLRREKATYQLLLPKWSHICQRKNDSKITPKTTWMTTEMIAEQWVASNWIPEARIAIVKSRRSQLQSLSLLFLVIKKM